MCTPEHQDLGKACRVRADDELLIAVMSHFQPNDEVAIYFGNTVHRVITENYTIYWSNGIYVSS